jgi:C4-dicarboxylate transporter, DctM subunit
MRQRNEISIEERGIGQFTPPMGVGLLMALRFVDVTVWRHARSYLPYLVALLVGLIVIIRVPDQSLFPPRTAGRIR